MSQRIKRAIRMMRIAQQESEALRRMPYPDLSDWQVVIQRFNNVIPHVPALYRVSTTNHSMYRPVVEAVMRLMRELRRLGLRVRNDYYIDQFAELADYYPLKNVLTELLFHLPNAPDYFECRVGLATDTPASLSVLIIMHQWRGLFHRFHLPMQVLTPEGIALVRKRCGAYPPREYVEWHQGASK